LGIGLGRLRRVLDVSNVALARRAGVDPSTLSRFERGRQPCAPPTVARFLLALEILAAEAEEGSRGA
jgi:transcriptional regulator with XRE-family HTH domain